MTPQERRKAAQERDLADALLRLQENEPVTASALHVAFLKMGYPHNACDYARAFLKDAGFEEGKPLTSEQADWCLNAVTRYSENRLFAIINENVKRKNHEQTTYRHFF